MKIVARQKLDAEKVVIQPTEGKSERIEAFFIEGQLSVAWFITTQVNVGTGEQNEMQEDVPAHYKVLIQDLYDAEKKA